MAKKVCKYNFSAIKDDDNRVFDIEIPDDILDEMESTRVLVSNSDFFLRPKTSQKKQANQPYMASVHITVSCGVAQKQPLQTYDEVINLADQALYKAKQTGRNKTVYNKDGKFFELF